LVRRGEPGGSGHAEKSAHPDFHRGRGHGRGACLAVQEVHDAVPAGYTNDDVVGVEIATSLKNSIAIAAGMLDGLGLGDNTKAALVTRGLAEITRLGQAMGASAETFSGLAGVGDLVVTCLSRHSRNRYLGEALGRGQTLERRCGMVMVAEACARTTRPPSTRVDATRSSSRSSKWCTGCCSKDTTPRKP
jgi:glycerol-3-phosphate dehydrogenase (NAD(P)+)